MKKSIHSYYFIYGDQNEHSYLAFPSTVKSILIGLNTKFNYTNSTYTTEASTGEYSIVLIDNIQTNTFKVKSGSMILQLNFSDLGLYSFVKHPISMLNETFFKEKLIVQIKLFLMKNKDFTEKNIIKNIENILISNYKKRDLVQLELALQLLKTSRNLKKVANEVNMSYQTFYRHFKKYMGLTPSLYFRIFRLKNVLLVNKNVLEAFFDESHFIREFKFFTGFTPNKYKDKLQTSFADFYYKMK